MTSTGPQPDGVIPSPNIWDFPDVYETENLGVDRGRLIEATMVRILGPGGWRGRRVLDIGCGSGFHLPRFAESASAVWGLEPYPPLAERARARVAQLPNVTVVQAPAAATTLPSASIDVAHARWAYFFGPGCEPGLRELHRVMRPGGTAFVIDNDATRSTFGRWFAQALPSYDAASVERFWLRMGWQRERLDLAWELGSRADFEAVVRIEFAPAAAERILAEDPARTGVDYAVNLWWRRY